VWANTRPENAVFREEDFADTPDQAFVPHPTPDMALPTGKTQAPYWIWQVRSVNDHSRALWYSLIVNRVLLWLNSMLPWLKSVLPWLCGMPCTQAPTHICTVPLHRCRLPSRCSASGVSACSSSDCGDSDNDVDCG